MVYVRADGNAHIGMGHVMRTLSLATALAKLDLPVCFLVSNPDGEGAKAVELVRNSGFTCRELPYAYQEKDAEIPYLSRELQDLPAVFVVDSYEVTKEYLSALREMGKVIYLDDLCEEIYPVDGILNYNIYAESLPYGDQYRGMQTKLFLGPGYAPIREAFCALRKQKLEAAPAQQKDMPATKRVLFTTGGGDSLHILRAVTESADKLFAEAEYHFLCGPLSEDRDLLDELAKRSDRKLVIHGPQEDMATFLNQFDLVASAAGSTLYELCTLGIPAIGFSFVDNQVRNLQGFVDQVGLPSAGAFDLEPQAALERLLTQVNAYVQDDEKRRDLANRMANLVNGEGAAVFAQEIEKIHEETIHS